MIIRTTLFNIFLLFLLIPISCSKDSSPPNLEEVRRNLFSTEKNLTSEDINTRISKAKSFPSLTPWALFLEAAILINENKQREGLDLLKLIPEDSAAFLDASLQRIRLGLSSNTSSSILERDLALLTEQITKADQSQLLPDVYYLKGELFERKKDYHAALSNYNKIRNQFPNSPLRLKAKERVKALTHEKDAPLPNQPLADQIAEVRTLIRERNFQEAYTILDRAKEKVLKGTPAFFEIRQEEVALLESSNRFAEADLLLNILSKEAPVQIASRSLLRRIKKHYENEEFSKTVSLIEDFLSRFRHNVFNEEVLFIHADILEKRGLNNDARGIYQELSKESSSHFIKLQVLKSLAWLSFKEQMYIQSQDQFKKLFDSAKEIESLLQANISSLSIIERYLPTSEKLGLKENVLIDSDKLKEEILEEVSYKKSHAAFWRARSLQELEKHDTATEWFITTIHLSPFSYYGIESSKIISTPFPSFGRVSDDPSQLVDKSQTCTITPDEEFKNRISLIIKSGLQAEAAREVHWNYAFNEALSPEYSVNQKMLLPLQMVSLFTDLGLHHESIKYIEKEIPLWKFEQALAKADSNFHATCQKEYLKRYFPKAPNEISELIEKESKEHSISINILYALARSESKFNHIDQATLEAIIKVQEHFLAPTDIFLAYLVGIEPAKNILSTIRTQFPKLPEDARIELFQDSETREEVKTLLISHKWHDAIEEL